MTLFSNANNEIWYINEMTTDWQPTLMMTWPEVQPWEKMQKWRWRLKTDRRKLWYVRNELICDLRQPGAVCEPEWLTDEKWRAIDSIIDKRLVEGRMADRVLVENLLASEEEAIHYWNEEKKLMKAWTK